MQELSTGADQLDVQLMLLNIGILEMLRASECFIKGKMDIGMEHLVKSWSVVCELKKFSADEQTGSEGPAVVTGAASQEMPPKAVDTVATGETTRDAEVPDGLFCTRPSGPCLELTT